MTPNVSLQFQNIFMQFFKHVVQQKKSANTRMKSFQKKDLQKAL